MYICPTCGKALENESLIQKHFLACWKELHPFHQSTPAPQLEDLIIKEVDNNVLSFFEDLQ